MQPIEFSLLNTTFLLASYLLGAIPTAFVVTKLLTGKDIREHGSGNAGGTNVMRVVGKVPGIFVILVDVGKGALVLSIVMHLSKNPHLAIASGFLAVIGHIWPVYTKFQGGKGVATTFGLFFSIEPITALASVGILVFLLILTKMMSLGSMVSILCFNLLLYLIIRPSQTLIGPLKNDSAIYLIILSIIVIYKHRSNIKRIIQGKENKLSLFSKGKSK
jgi:glycerol-3-phosphate acyltransferase PlsY